MGSHRAILTCFVVGFLGFRVDCLRHRKCRLSAWQWANRETDCVLSVARVHSVAFSPQLRFTRSASNTAIESNVRNQVTRSTPLARLGMDRVSMENRQAGTINVHSPRELGVSEDLTTCGRTLRVIHQPAQVAYPVRIQTALCQLRLVLCNLSQSFSKEWL